MKFKEKDIEENLRTLQIENETLRKAKLQAEQEIVRLNTVDITERKNVEDILRKSEASLKTLIKTIPDLIWLKDKDGVYLACNNMFERFFGATESEIVGKTDFDFVNRELAEFFREHDQKAMGLGKPSSNEEWITFADDGHRALLDTIKTPMFDNEGKLVGVLGIARDITERRESEEEIKRNVDIQNAINSLLALSLEDLILEDFLSRTLDLLFSLEIFSFEKKGAIFIADNSLDKLIMKVQKSLSPELLELCSNIPYGRCLCGKAAITKKIVFASCIDQEHEILFEGIAHHGHYCVPILSSDNILGVLNIYVKNGYESRTEDVDLLTAIANTLAGVIERKQAEERLSKSEEKYRSIFENVQDVYYETSIGGTILEISPSIEILSKGQYKREEIIGKSMYDFYSDANRRLTILKSLEENGSVLDYPVPMMNRDGSIVPCSVSSKICLDKNGNPLMIVGTIRDITERTKAEEAIAVKNANLQTQQEVSLDGILVVDEAGDIVSYNAHFIEMWGIPPEIIKSKSDKYTLDYVVNQVSDPNVFLKKVIYLYENQGGKSRDEILLKDGRIFDRYSAPMNMPDGRYLGRVWYFRDITERKLDEREKFRLLDIVEKSLNEIYVFNPNTLKFEYLNQGALQNLGYEFEEMKNMTVLDIKPEFTKPVFEKMLEPLIRGDLNILVFETIHKRKNDTEYPVEVHLQLHKQEDKSLFFAVVSDITERKLSEQAMRESEEKFRSYIENAPDGVFVTDENGNYVLVNDAASRITGYDKVELLQMNLIELIFDEDKELAIKQFQSVVEKGNALGENRFVKKNGVVRNWEIKAVKMTDSRFLGFVSDITEDKLAEEALIQAKERAEESDRLKTAFLANMSHEIRTPMNGILGFTGLLKDQNITIEEQKDYISVIEQSGKRLLNIINDLLDISKIASGQMEINFSEFNVNEQIENIYNCFKPELETKEIKFTYFNSLSIEEANITADREKFYAVLTNLVNNACKFTITGVIEFGYICKNDFLEFFIKDTGIGIPKDKLKAIFERFVQADISLSRNYEGAGLGLSIAKAYVDMLGGNIWVESEEGKGTQFYFTIPRF